MFRFLLSATTCLGFLCGNPVPAAAQDSPDKDKTETSPKPADAPTAEAGKPIRLDPVIVGATRRQSTVSDLPVSSSVMTQQQVQDSPAVSTDDVLRDITSLHSIIGLPSYMNHPTGNSLLIRGLAAPLVLVDGVPFNDPFFQYVPYNRIPKDQIGRIEVVRGGMSSLWGGFAEGGVVNIITKPIDASKLQVSGYGGSYGTAQADLYGSRKLSQELGGSFNINYFKTDGFDSLAPAARQPWNVPASSESLNLQLKTEYQAADADAFIRANFYQNSQTLETNIQTNDTHTLSLATGAKWKQDAQNDLQTNLFFLHQTFDSNGSSPDPNTGGEYLSNAHQTPATDIGGSLQWTHRSQQSTALPLFTAGVDVRHIEGFDYAQSIDASSLPPYALSVHNSGGKQLQAGVFGEAQFTPAKAWEIWPSMRFDYVRSYAGRAEDISGGGPLITTRYADNEFTQFSPKVATRYELTDAVATRASVYRSFRMPTFENLYRGFVASGFSLQPDPQTKPEKLWGGEVGLDFAQGRLHGQANLFYNKIRDQITYVPVSFFPVFTLKATNIGESDVRGVELIGDAQVTEALSFGISYSYNDARIVSYPPDPSIEGNRVPQSPAHTVSAVARYNQPSGPRVELRVYYASSSFDDTSNTLRVDPRTVVDISAGYPLGKTVELFLIAQNVFDEKYVATTLRGVHYGAPFQIFGGIKATFGGR